ncbi:MAG: ABC transporter permease, partial [bacterium]|nr:ABC transporter permease [bacterium]
FWFTPVFWNIDRIPEQYKLLVKLNPVYYLVLGYRDSLIYKTWFWERPQYTLYFWGLTLVVFAVGSLLFLRLKPHFGEML